MFVSRLFVRFPLSFLILLRYDIISFFLCFLICPYHQLLPELEVAIQRSHWIEVTRLVFFTSSRLCGRHCPTSSETMIFIYLTSVCRMKRELPCFDRVITQVPPFWIFIRCPMLPLNHEVDLLFLFTTTTATTTIIYNRMLKSLKIFFNSKAYMVNNYLCWTEEYYYFTILILAELNFGITYKFYLQKLNHNFYFQRKT